MKNSLVIGILAAGAAVSTGAATFTSFNYSQSDATTGSGTIAPFSYAGHDFTATPLPAATVLSPGPVVPPSGFVGSQTVASGGGNDNNPAIGLLWTGVVTATATSGATIQIPLVFAPKQTQTPTDTSDYNWSVSFGDSPANGSDIAAAGYRFAMLLGRDPSADAIETPDTFQRYTQQTHTTVAGLDTFSNTHTTTTAIKDATDPAGAPAGTDAAGRNLEFYWAWRDGGTALTGGQAFFVDQFDVGGLLQVNEASLVVPEPTTGLLLLGGLGALVAWRRRK